MGPSTVAMFADVNVFIHARGENDDAARLLGAAQRGSVQLETSIDVLETRVYVLTDPRGRFCLSREEAENYRREIEDIVVESGGQIGPRATAQQVRMASSLVPSHMAASRGRESGVDHEDHRIIAGALVSGASVLVTGDQALINCAPNLVRHQVVVVSTSSLAARRVI